MAHLSTLIEHHMRRGGTLSEVQVEGKNTEWKIVDLRRRQNHMTPLILINERRFVLYAESYLPDSVLEKYWLVWLFQDPNCCSVLPLYYTVSVVDHYGQNVLTRKGTVEEQAASARKVLLVNLAEYFLRKNNLINNGTLTLSFTLELNWDGRKEPKLSTVAEPSKLLETLSKNFITFYESKTNTDCVLRVSGAQFPAHRAVLSARSTVFSAMFHHDTNENRSGEVDIPDVDATTLRNVLYYIYSGKIQGLNSDTATSMYTIADKYALMELRTECLELLKDNLTMENFCDAALLTHTHGEKELEERVVQFMEKNFEEVVKSNAWEQFSKHNAIFATMLLTCAFMTSKGKEFQSIAQNNETAG